MKKGQIISIVVGAFVAGVIITVFSYQAYTVYQFRSVVTNEHATLTQIVDFLNQNIQQAQQAQQAQQKAPAAQATAPATPKK